MAFTFFFRDLQTLELVAEHAIPVFRGRLRINIWDAGCAMGPEPYSLAIVLRENMSHFLFRNVRIHATDIDEQDTFGPTITQGIYPYEQLQRMPADILGKYFHPTNGNGSQYQIADEIREAVVFQKHNLLTLRPIRDNFSLIVCKNVLLHFSPAERVQVMRMFHDALADDGFLVTEHTQLLPDELTSYFRPVVANARIYHKIPADRGLK